jgi:hypothetical protein
MVIGAIWEWFLNINLMGNSRRTICLKIRTDLLNYLIKKHKCKSYLEIGIQDAVNFKAIKCEKKIGVDPNCNFENVEKVKSDEFFANNDSEFDLIFIDGDHTYEQAKSDILNALKIVRKFIVCHDVLPIDENHTNIYLNGGVYRAIADIICDGLADITTVNIDHGCGILTIANNKKIENPIIDWNSFNNNKHIYNIIDEQDFISSSGIGK